MKRTKPEGSGRQLAWPPTWAALAEAAGGVDALATKLGTTRDVVARWSAGRAEPSGTARVAVRYVAAELGVHSPV